MTQLRFVGDLGIEYGLLLAAAAAAAAGWLYLRQLRRDGRHALARILAALRAAAIAMVLLMLTGPVVRHRQAIGELGRVLVVVDGSQSMSLDDRYHSPAGKLLASRALGLLPSAAVDTTLADAADALADASAAAASVARPASGVPVPDACRRFLRATERAAELIGRWDSRQLPANALPVSSQAAGSAAAAAGPPADPGSQGNPSAVWQAAVERFRRQLLEPARELDRSDPGASRPPDEGRHRLQELSAVAAEYRSWLEALFETAARDAVRGTSNPIRVAVERFEGMSRWQRAARLLAREKKGLLRQLARSHDVELLELAGDSARTLWTSRDGADPATSFKAFAAAPSTNLSQGLQSRLGLRSHSAAPAPAGGGAEQRTAVVLLSDGRHNQGPPPIETARLIAAHHIPLFAVGLGSDRPPPDLAMLAVESPASVFRDDRVRGRLVLADHLPPGQQFAVQIRDGQAVLWEQTLKTTGSGRRAIEFDFPIREAVDRVLVPESEDVRIRSLPLALQARIAPVAGEMRSDNNHMPLHLRAVARRHRLLLVDSRPRWETRYARNLFDRDPRWEVNCVLAGPASGRAELRRGSKPGAFPADRAALFRYDLVLWGDIGGELFREEELGWLKEFVEHRGGGLILLDGARQGLRSLAATPARPLFPVRWSADTAEAQPRLQRLTEAGRRLPALILASEGEDNAALWQRLPPPHRAAPAEALPGTETLAEAVLDRGTVPTLVGRMFGAGRVLYCGCDETWRWRREVAERYHERFWMQVARWIMEEPFAASDRYVSLDVGSVVYEPGASADVRVRLRDESGRPVAEAAVEAILWRDGRVAAAVTLSPDGRGGGLFRGRSGPLAAGEYEVRVRVNGSRDDQFPARTRFRVESPPSMEMADLTCDRALLEEMAAITGGRFCREDQTPQLVDLLQPLSAGRVIESETALWQSYWWFVPIVILLGSEWWIRKRSGLA